jgi:hypothetical protein
MVRAKLRVLEVTHHLRGNTTFLKLKPVIGKSKDWPEGCEENLRFWEASPSGEMDLRYVRGKGVVIPFELGDFVYVDMELKESPEGQRDWELYKVSQSETQLEIWFGLGWVHEPGLVSANFELAIENRGAWDAFLGNHGKKWCVTLTKAEGDHDGCPMTGPC